MTEPNERVKYVPSKSEDDPPKAASISDTWLIYRYGKEPYELAHCSRSRPVEFVDEKELKALSQLVRTPEVRHEP